MRVVKSIFGKRRGLEEGGGRPVRGSSVWSGIIKIGTDVKKWGIDLSSSFGMEVGKGDETSFWENRWVNGEVLRRDSIACGTSIKIKRL